MVYKSFSLLIFDGWVIYMPSCDRAESFHYNELFLFTRVCIISTALVLLTARPDWCICTPGPPWQLLYVSPSCAFLVAAKSTSAKCILGCPRKGHGSAQLCEPNLQLYNIVPLFLLKCPSRQVVCSRWTLKRSPMRTFHRVMRIPNPSTQFAQDPVTPATV